jgi:hypothetical protein
MSATVQGQNPCSPRAFKVNKEEHLQTCAHCTAQYGNCQNTGSCCDAGFSCFEKFAGGYAQCLRSCKHRPLWACWASPDASPTVGRARARELAPLNCETQQGETRSRCWDVCCGSNQQLQSTPDVDPLLEHMTEHNTTYDPFGHFAVVPNRKLLFCWIEKNGCQTFVDLLCSINRHHKPGSSPARHVQYGMDWELGCNWKSSAYWSQGMEETQVIAALDSDEWTKAVFVRDPLER